MEAGAVGIVLLLVGSSGGLAGNSDGLAAIAVGDGLDGTQELAPRIRHQAREEALSRTYLGTQDHGARLAEALGRVGSSADRYFVPTAAGT